MTNTELAILSLVAESPKHGYQVEADITARGMREWTEIGFSSIYYVLKKMATKDWLESRLSDEGPRAIRKVFQITPAGYDALKTAVTQRLTAPRRHSGDIELGLACLPVLSPSQIVAALRNCLELKQQTLSNIHTKRNVQSKEGSLPPHVNALFDYSIAMIEAEISWVANYLSQQENALPSLEKPYNP